jgi:hypothetical protein
LGLLTPEKKVKKGEKKEKKEKKEEKRGSKKCEFLEI